MGRKDDDYNDIPDWTGYCPDCPNCGETMRYSYVEDEFKCFSCGYTMDADDWDYENDVNYIPDDEDEPPFGCRACGGPWPDCVSSCNLMGD